MQMEDINVARRTLVGAAGFGVLVGFAGVANAAGGAAAAKHPQDANLALVKAFIASWTAPDFDPDVSMPKFLAPECNVRMMETMPFQTKPAEVATTFKGFLAPHMQLHVKYLSTYVRGPIVVTHRIDTVTVPDKPDQKFEVAGVFFVKDGKIKEWTDYVLKA
jgi:limonene-1,2-epoxide hydrolase